MRPTSVFLSTSFCGCRYTGIVQRHLAYLAILKHQRCAIANVILSDRWVGVCLRWVPVRLQLLVGSPCPAAAFGVPDGSASLACSPHPNCKRCLLLGASQHLLLQPGRGISG